MLVQCSKLHKFCIFFYLNDYYSHTAHSARLAPSPFLSPLFFTHPHSHPPRPSWCLPPAVWLWVFWLSPDVDQTPVNYTGQVTPSRLAFCFFFSFFKSPRYSVFHFVALASCALSICWKDRRWRRESEWIWSQKKKSFCRNINILK